MQENNDLLEGGEHIVETQTVHENEGTDHSEPSGNQISFDDVDAFTSDSKTEKEVAKLFKQKDKATTKEAKQPKKEVNSEKEGTKVNIDESSEQNAEKIIKEAKEKESQTRGQSETKRLQYKFADGEHDIPAEAKFVHKVDGEEVEVPLQELLNNYSGKVSWDRKYQTLAEEKRQFQTEVETIEKYVHTFANKAQQTDENGNRDFLGAMTYLAEMAGMNPLDFKAGIREQMLPLMQQWANMNDEERRNLQLREENDYYDLKKNEQQTRIQEEQAALALEKELQSLQRENGLDDATIVKAWDELDGELDASQEITNQMLVERANFINKTREAEQLIGEVNSDALHTHSDAPGEIAKIMLENPYFGKEDLVNIIEQVYGRKKEKVVSDKVRQSQPRAESQMTVTEETAAPLSFDEI